MKMKIVGILVCMLLIATALPAVGDINEIVNIENKFLDYKTNMEFVPGEFIVKLTKDTQLSSPSITVLNEKYQVSSIEKVFRNTENTILDNIYLLSVPEESDILSIVSDYSSNPYVLYAEPNGLVFRCGIPNDENFSKQWALDNTGQTGGTPDADIDAPEAWDIETGEPDIVIAIIDTGVDYTHPDLANNIWNNEDEILGNGIDDDDNGYIDDVIGWDWRNDNDPLDDNGHGTICAGIAAAVTDNGVGIAGVCWDCNIMSLKVCSETGSASWSDTGSAIEYAADNDADVISMSLGGYSNSSTIWDAVNYAYDEGAILVAAVGNDNTSNEFYPAAYDNVIGVAGTDHNDSRMYYYYEPPIDEWCISNYGPWVDVAAPGQEIYSTMPTYHVYANDFGIPQNYSGGLVGTSFSCPHVAGLAALMLSKDPTLSPEDVKSLICENVDPYVSDEYIGTGRINAYKALTSRTAFLIGLITNLNSSGEATSFIAKMILSVGFKPFGINFYISNEKIFISEDKLGYVGSRFIIGLFKTAVV